MPCVSAVGLLPPVPTPQQFRQGLSFYRLPRASPAAMPLNANRMVMKFYPAIATPDRGPAFQQAAAVRAPPGHHHSSHS